MCWSTQVVQGAYSSAQLEDGQELTSLNDEKTIKVTKNDTGVFIEGEEGGPVQVVTPDVLASNGVVHMINGVLIPSDQFDQLEQMTQSGQEGGQ